MFKRFMGLVLASMFSLLASVPAFAEGTDPISTALATIDLTAVGVAVAAIVVLVIAIAMGFKGADLGKRAVRKV